MLLALPGDSRGADHRGKESLVFRRQYPADMVKPFCHHVGLLFHQLCITHFALKSTSYGTKISIVPAA